jgi:hypothetical protein
VLPYYLRQLITLHAHGIRPRACRAELARKRPAGKQSPGRPLYYLYSSEESGWRSLTNIFSKLLLRSRIRHQNSRGYVAVAILQLPSTHRNSQIIPSPSPAKVIQSTRQISTTRLRSLWSSFARISLFDSSQLQVL